MPNRTEPITQDQFLASYRLEDYDRPSVATDLVVFSMAFTETQSYRQDAQGRLEVLLVQRTEPPYQGMWSLPGGFLRKGETLEQCAARKLQAKTGVAPALLIPAGVYSDPQRDPRGWIISRALMSILPEADRPAVQSGACWFTLETQQQPDGCEQLVLTHEDTRLTMQLMAGTNGYGQTAWQQLPGERLAFDHAQILMTALMDLRWGAAEFRYIFDFLPPRFTLSALQGVQEIITGKALGAANFRRKAAAYVQETDETTEGVGHRPAKLYCRRMEAVV